MVTIEIAFPSDRPAGKILKWKVRSDTMVVSGRVLLLYRDATPSNDDVKEPEKKLRATRFGRVKQFLAKEGDVVQPGQVIILLEGCTHPTVMIDLCAECGADLRMEQTGMDGKAAVVSQASVPMVHSIPELKVCPELAEKIGKEDEQRLLKDRKLVLLVDLDQTIVHTTNDHIPPDLKDVYHFQLYGPNSPWYHTRLRPNTRHFLSEMSRLYELHICSFGARIYAHTIASLLDKDGILFSHRILSRDECFDPASKTANLKALFPCGDDLVCIIDDREDVWQGCGNLVQVKPYHYFRHTGDINAPPGLEKSDPSRPPDPKNVNESCENDSLNKESKGDMPELLNELTSSSPVNEMSSEGDENCDKLSNKDSKGDMPELNELSALFSVKEINSEKDENCDKSEETESESTKANTEKDVNSKAAIIITENKDDNTKEEVIDKEVTDKEITGKEIIHKEVMDKEITDKEIIHTEVTDKEVDKEMDEEIAGKEITDKEQTNKQAVEKEIMENVASVEVDANTKQEALKNSNIVDEDDDDYLLYLEDILRKIHTEFYLTLDKGNGRKSLRDIIPRVRSQVLKGLYLTFSGLIPTHQKLHQSRAYKVARAFGAEVTQDLTEKTTHLVAIRKGTAKANLAKKNTNMQIVNPEWLWTCAERWEHVDERLFPVTSQARGSRVPPPHCSSPESVEEIESNNSKECFANTINPLMSLTSEEIEIMDKEVEQDMAEQDNADMEDMDDMDDMEQPDRRMRRRSSDSEDSMNDWPEMKRQKIQNGNSDESSSEDDKDNNRSYEEEDDDDDDSDDNDDDDHDIAERFRRGENFPDDLDLDDNSQDSIGDLDDGDNDDDREWNALGAALEREFLTE